MTKRAYTLAEVLITLGIIGVVAALTISVLSHNIQKYVLKNQFKKTYNTLSNAINKVYTDLEYRPACTYGYGHGGLTECEMFTKQFISNLNVIKKCTKAKEQECIKYIRALYDESVGSVGLRQSYIDNKNYTYLLKDGSMIMLYDSGIVPIYIIDVNGHKGPNKW